MFSFFVVVCIFILQYVYTCIYDKEAGGGGGISQLHYFLAMCLTQVQKKHKKYQTGDKCKKTTKWQLDAAQNSFPINQIIKQVSQINHP